MKNSFLFLFCITVLPAPSLRAETTEPARSFACTEGGLPIQLVVVKKNSTYRPKLEDVTSYSVAACDFFWLLEPKDGKDGFYRFGTDKGEEIGWIKNEFVKEWKTPFALSPLKPEGDRVFTIRDEKGKTIAQCGDIPSKGDQCVTLVLDTVDNKPVNSEEDKDMEVAVIVIKVDHSVPNMEPESSVLIGIANLRNDSNHLVTVKQVLVTRSSMRRTIANLTYIYKQLKGMTDQSKRVKVKRIVNDLKEVVLALAPGATIDGETNLGEVIQRDFPIRLDIIDVSDRNISTWDNGTFDRWLGNFADMLSRLKDIDKDEDKWMSLPLPEEFKMRSGADDEQFRFIPVTTF